MSLEQLQRQDHDTLVTIVVKLDDLKADVKDLKDGMSLKIADHEGRIKKMEDLVLEVNAMQSYKEFLKLKDRVHDFRIYLAVASAIGGFLMYLLTQLPNWIRLFLR